VGRDNHPRERKARALARKKGKRPPHPRVLIVTEGEKTEPQYFDEIRKKLRISAARIRIADSDYGTEPRQIVDYAADLFREQERQFDKVFAVFDRDEHRTYHDALQACARTKLRNDQKKWVKFRAVPSNPCFELWLLLHCEDIHDLLHRNEIYRKLKQHIPDYEKAFPGTFERTHPALRDAVIRAKRLQARYRPEDDTEGPYTNVDTVVDLLLSMKRPD
jgi:RloB-like protein